MAVTRQFNWLGQQRVDLPHLRLIEVAVAYDFDTLAGIAISGRKPLIVSGFEIIETGAVGNDAENLIMIVARSTAYHFEATESGSIFHVSDDRANEVLSPTNARMDGAFVPNTTNFVGIDFVRSADDTTVDNVAFYNKVSDSEIFETVPLARTIDYKIVVSTTEFSATPGVLPVATVATDTSNKVVSITDARNLMYRLNAPYSWPTGRAADADLSLTDQKAWQDAVMTRIWEVGGGEYWDSPTDYRNVRLVGAGAVFVSTGEYWEVVANNVHWQNLRVIFDNSTSKINEILDQTVDQPGLTDLADGECVFVDLDRTQDRTGLSGLVAQKSALVTLGQSAVPGQRYVICWRSGANFFVRDQPYAIGGSFKIATTLAYGTVKIASNPDLGIWDAASPVVPVIAMVAGAGYTATAGGISHNQDGGFFGSSDTILPAGDIQIGRGINAGDFNIQIYTDDNSHQTHIRGIGEQSVGGGGTSVLDIDSDAGGFSPGSSQRNRITTQRGLSTVGAIKRVVHFVETDGSVGQAITSTVPATAELTSEERVRAKYFLQPSKRWLQPCNYATDVVGLDPYVAAGSGIGKTLTAVAPGFLTPDGFNVLLGERVLVKDELDAFNNGIYECTIEGDGGTAWELTRAADADENQEMINGIAVSIESGTVNGGTSWILTTLDALQIDVVEQIWVADQVSNFIVRKSNVLAATTVALPSVTESGVGVGKTLTATANGALFIDLLDMSTFPTPRVLVKNQVNPIDNGIYIVTDGGSIGTPFVLTRASDADGVREVCTGMGVYVTAGTVNGGTSWKMTTPNEIVVDTSNLQFGLTNTETRDQRCVRWWDGSVDVLQESPAYTPIFEPTFVPPVS